MQTFRTIVTVGQPGEIVLTNVPVSPGEVVEVVVRSCDVERNRRADEARLLMQRTQLLPQLQSLTEAELAAEIAAVRANS